MRLDEALQTARIDRADGEVLLAALLGQDRAWLMAHGGDALPANREEQWKAYADRRRRHEPVALILGQKEFYGRMFTVTPATLVPRPATEELVSLALEVLKGGKPGRTMKMIDTGIVALAFVREDPRGAEDVVDIGTGSGCIAVTLACERPDLRVIATDVSATAIAVAKKNAYRHGADDRIEFREGSLLEPVTGLREPFLIVSNPPYIPEDRELPPDVSLYEPEQALYAGKDGLAVLRPLVAAAHKHPACLGIVVECEQAQVERLSAL